MFFPFALLFTPVGGMDTLRLWQLSQAAPSLGYQERGAPQGPSFVLNGGDSGDNARTPIPTDRDENAGNAIRARLSGSGKGS